MFFLHLGSLLQKHNWRNSKELLVSCKCWLYLDEYSSASALGIITHNFVGFYKANDRVNYINKECYCRFQLVKEHTG